MEYREHGRIKLVKYAAIALVVTFIVYSCRTEGSVPVNRWIKGDTVHISSIRGITSFNGEPANGILFFLGERGDTILRKAYRDGKENGESKVWFENGALSECRHYVNGKKEGTHFGWYSNGTPRFIYHFVNDDFNGEYTEWYTNGQLFRQQNFVAGHENGRQRIWFESGKIKSNYVIKNNKRYGLFGTQNCVNVADSVSS